MSGWIRIHREIVEHWIYKDAEYLKVWLEMLVRARYWDDPSMELVEDQLVKIERGDFIFGRPKWSKRLGISEQRLKTLIQKMIKDDMIELVQKYNRFTVYKIKNYEKFNQQDNQQINQQDNQQEDQTPSGFDGCGNQQNNQHDNQQSNQQSTSSQPASNQQSTINKESKERNKNDKKVKKEDKTAFEDYTSNPTLLESLNSFLEYRKKIKKPMTDRAIKLLLGELDKLANNDQDKIAILEQSILNGWQGIFPLKAQQGKQYKPTNAKQEIKIVEKSSGGGVSDEEFQELLRMAERMESEKGSANGAGYG